MGTTSNIFFVIWTLSLLFSGSFADAVLDARYAYAQAYIDSLYGTHIRVIAEGHSVGLGQIGCAHFFREAYTPTIGILYNNSLIAAVTCALGYRQEYATLGYNLTNYGKTDYFCHRLDSQLSIDKKCNLLTNVGPCVTSYPYRQIDGYCTNLKYPKWGAQLTPYGRLIAGNFDDGGRNPRLSTYNYQDLPKPRYLGNSLYSNYVSTVQSKSNYFAVLFGQFAAHDIGERAYYQVPQGGPDFNACTADNSAILPADHLAFGTVPIDIPANDPYLAKYGVRCLDFVRTQPQYRNDCKFSGAEFANVRTHFMDASNIYGSLPNIAETLRGKNGRLLINELQILPQRVANVTAIDYDRYFTAEDRGVPFYTLAIIHSIFIREHNRIADELHKLNPTWNDEKLYQESRRIVIALHQHIVYNEWIPTLFGADFAKEYKLNAFEQPYCGSYNEETDTSASNEFSHAALRQFHMNIPEKFNFYDSLFLRYKTVPLYETDNGPKILETDYNGVLRGMLKDPNIAGPSSFSDTMRNKIFDNFNPRNLGMDMPSNDILVGRDQGLSPYHMYLEKYFNHKVNTWEDLSVTISKKNIDKLKLIYAGVKDLDLYVGLSLETRDYDNYKYVGPVGKFILGEQFKRTKFGDRFFYCLRDNANPFTSSQLNEINQMTLARLLCQNVKIESMLPKAFSTPSNTNIWTSCKLFQPMNLNAWKAK